MRTRRATASDGSPGEVFSFTSDWDGDGSPAQTVSGPSGTTVDHTFEQEGTFTISKTATGAAGQSTAPAAHAITARGIQVQDDSAGSRIVVVGGSVGDDIVHVQPSDAPNFIKEKVRELDFDVRYRDLVGRPTARIVAFGQAGDDVIQVSGDLCIGAEPHGGPGDDRLRGGDGDDLLIRRAGQRQPHRPQTAGLRPSKPCIRWRPVRCRPSAGGRRRSVGCRLAEHT